MRPNRGGDDQQRKRGKKVCRGRWIRGGGDVWSRGGVGGSVEEKNRGGGWVLGDVAGGFIEKKLKKKMNT